MVGPEGMAWKLQAESDSDGVSSFATIHYDWAPDRGSSRTVVLKLEHVSEWTSVLVKYAASLAQSQKFWFNNAGMEHTNLHF